MSSREILSLKCKRKLTIFSSSNLGSGVQEGKVHCQCIRRKWKFCPSIKRIADGRITPTMLTTTERGDRGTGWDGWTGWGRSKIRMEQVMEGEEDQEDGDSNGPPMEWMEWL